MRKTGKKASQVAKEAGITHAVLSRFLAGINGLSVRNMTKIVAATAGQVTLEDLLPSKDAKRLAEGMRRGAERP